MSTAEALQAHLQWLRLRGLRPATVKSRRGAVLRLQRALPCALLDVTEDDLQKWQEGLRLGVYALSTETAHVAQFYRWAVRTHHRIDDPTGILIRPRIPASVPRPISEADLRMALACAPDRIRPWLVLAGWCGLRAREIALLERPDIRDQDDPPTLFVRDGKGGKQRVVPLPRTVIAELMAWGMPARGALFRRADDTPGPLSPGRLSKVAAEYLHSIGLQATLHSLRHRYATVSYQATHDLLLVRDYLGHESTNTTAGYAKINPAAPAALLAALNGSLSSPPMKSAA